MKNYKFFAIITLLSIFFSMVGCTSNSQSTTLNTTMSNESTYTTPPTTTEPIVIPKTYTELDGFSEGLAWVKYSDNGDYCGCINEKGEMLFAYNDNEIDVLTGFENGYAYLLSSGKTMLYIIDKSGNICSSYKKDTVSAYGYGYTVVENHQSNFDSEYYDYIVYDANGDESYTFHSNDTSAKFYHWGEGLFLIDAESNYLFSAPINKMTDYNHKISVIDEGDTLNNGLALVNGNGFDLVVDSQANITYPDSSKFSSSAFYSERVNTLVYGNSVVFYNDEEPSLLSFNLVTNNVYYLDDTYVDKLITTYNGSVYDITLADASFNNDGFLVSMIGQDKNRYVAILDYEMNLQKDPIRYHENYIAYDNGTCSIDGEIYDMKGNIIYSPYSKGFETIITDSENILFVSKSTSNIDLKKDLYDGPYGKCNFAAVDKDGNVVFDAIDTTNTIIKTTSNN